MTLLTPEQQTIWRSSPHSLLLDVYVDAPQTVFAARLNDSSHLLVPSYTTLPYDGVTTGAYTDLYEGMVVLLGTSAGADDLGRTYLSNIYPSKVCANGAALYIVRASQGRHDGEIIPTDNAYITVLDMRPIYATPPLIDVTGDPGNPITKKAGVVAFNSTYEFEPVCIMGGDRLVKVASASDTYEFVYDWSASYVTHPSGGSITAYDADFGGEDTSSAASGTVELPVGRHRIRLTITDSLGSTFTSWRTWVVTYDGDANLITGYQITRHSERADGQSFQMRLSKPLSYGTYPDGCEVWVRMREDYGGTEGSLGWLEYHEDMVLSGWIAEESNEGEATRRGFIGRTTLTIDDAAGRLKRLAGFPQVVERRATPTRWEHMASANMDRYLYYLLRWHSNALQRVDYIQSGYGAIYPFTVIGSDGQSLWEQVAKRAEAIACVLTCDRYNRLVVLDDPIIAPSATQIVDALTLFSAYLPQQRTDDVLADIYESDWKNYRFDWVRPPRTHWNWGEAIVASTHNGDSGVDIATVFCIAPGAAPGQGSSEERSGEQLVIASYGQVQLNYREGNRYAARMNAAMGYLTADIRPGDAGLSPARMKWIRFTQTSATAAPRGRTIAAERFLPVELQYRYDHKNGIRKTTMVMEHEVEGTPAETYVPYSGTRTTYPPITIRPPVVVPKTPTAGVSLIASGLAVPNECDVQFTDLSTVAGDVIVSWEWDFGDSTTSTLQNPLHVYPANDTYSWTLTVTTARGATDTDGDDVVVDSCTAPDTWSHTYDLTEATYGFVKAFGQPCSDGPYIQCQPLDWSEDDGFPIAVALGAMSYAQRRGGILRSLSGEAQEWLIDSITVYYNVVSIGEPCGAQPDAPTDQRPHVAIISPGQFTADLAYISSTGAASLTWDNPIEGLLWESVAVRLLIGSNYPCAEEPRFVEFSPEYDPGGEAYITSITITGHGDDPFDTGTDPFTHDFTFGATALGWTGTASSSARFVVGDLHWTNELSPPASPSIRRCYIKRELGTTRTITAVRAVGQFTEGTPSAGSATAFYVALNSESNIVYTRTFDNLALNTPDLDEEWSGSEAEISTIYIGVISDDNSAHGTISIDQIVVEGLGVDPF